MNKFKKSTKLGDILLYKEEITQEQLDSTLSEQAGSGKRLGEILIEKGFISEKTLLNTLSEQLGIDIVNLDNFPISVDATRLISEKLAIRTNAIPLKILKDKLMVAMSEPLNIFDIEDIEMESGKKAEVVLASKSQITNAIEKYMSSRSTELAVEDFNKETLKNEDFDNIAEEVDVNVSNSPVVRLINSLIRQALKMGASDIHIEPLEDRLRVRVRVDGELQEILTPSKHTQSAIVTRVKIISGMNIAEKRLPQDGRIELKIDNSEIDLRISVLPTVYGEKIVMRLLDRGNFLKSKMELGFTEHNLETFDSILNSPNGVILVTGPTGSGKTTTLYAALNELNTMNKNIITVEDPVEYKIEGINQVQVNTKAGLLFSTGLRSILRQDPDIIMVGEIRDEDTAEIAVRAAITGHLVISTLHTNDAPSTIMRLQDMGIKPFLIAASIRGIVAQRLVKRICSNCKTAHEATDVEKDLLEAEGDVTIYKGRGCPKCFYTGYSGRIAIHEVLKVDKEVREAIQSRKSIDELTEVAQKGGMTFLKDNCRELVLSGITSMDEYSRVVFKLE
jgi:type IV pilus assembly protein PilB